MFSTGNLDYNDDHHENYDDEDNNKIGWPFDSLTVIVTSVTNTFLLFELKMLFLIQSFY